MNMTSAEEDEALARALQEQYRQEFERRSSRPDRPVQSRPAVTRGDSGKKRVRKSKRSGTDDTLARRTSQELSMRPSSKESRPSVVAAADSGEKHRSRSKSKNRSRGDDILVESGKSRPSVAAAPDSGEKRRSRSKSNIRRSTGDDILVESGKSRPSVAAAGDSGEKRRSRSKSNIRRSTGDSAPVESGKPRPSVVSGDSGEKRPRRSPTKRRGTEDAFAHRTSQEKPRRSRKGSNNSSTPKERSSNLRQSVDPEAIPPTTLLIPSPTAAPDPSGTRLSPETQQGGTGSSSRRPSAPKGIGDSATRTTKQKRSVSKSRPRSTSKSRKTESIPAAVPSTSRQSKTKSPTREAREVGVEAAPPALWEEEKVEDDPDLELALRLEREERDAELARKLMRQEEKAAAASQSRNKTPSSRSKKASRSSLARSQNDDQAVASSLANPPVVAAVTTGTMEATENFKTDVDNAELAQKLEQEELDEELARELMRAEQQSISQQAALQEARHASLQRRWTCRRVTSLSLPIVIIVAAVVGITIAFVGENGLSSPFFDNDPYRGSNPDDANIWRTRGKGLTLHVLNAMEDKWDEIFNVTILDWDFGTPDALTLTTEKIAYDPKCSHVTGKVKVCNADYGDTRWRGLNQVVISKGYIIWSIAKLNERYLNDDQYYQRRYTCCHELGHAWGLPHTDENFYNKDLEDCMDYTTKPKNNLKPNLNNYNFLAELYGEVELQPSDGDKRNLRNPSSERRMQFSSETEDFPNELLPAYEAAVEELERRVPPTKGWNLLHKNPHSEFRTKDLGNGYTLQVRMLLDD